MRPTQFLRLEAVAVLAGALATYVWLDGPIWLLVVLILAPDLSMLAYLGGPRLGSLGYNVVHLYAWPVALAGLGVWPASASGSMPSSRCRSPQSGPPISGWTVSPATG